MPNLGFRPNLERRRAAAGGAPPPDYVALMQTLLSGTTGFVTDPGDASINFTDTAGTTPVSVPGVSTVARKNSKFGTTTYNWQQATGASQYLWNGASFQADGTDDGVFSTAGMGFSNAMTGLTWTYRFLVDDLTVTRCLFSCSTATSTAVRFQPRIQTDGSITLGLRRTDAEAQQNFTTSAGVITTATTYTLQIVINYLNGAVEFFLNGSSIFTGTHTGTDGINGVSATNSARSRWGLNTSNTLNDWYDGKLGASVWVRSVLAGADLANCRGFVERNAL